MGVIEEPCVDIVKKIKKKRNLSSINIPKEKTDNLDFISNNHRISIHIKKTWKKSAINKKILTIQNQNRKNLWIVLIYLRLKVQYKVL